ncbi:MAG: AAA family ATPase [Anaerolineales bacterium]|nr:AAA family ATPase [Anaerolineales bacterium]
MARAPFVGRNSELKLLDDLWASSSAELLILYGRRRVGKTRLITHWIEQTQNRCLYWVADPTSSHDQLRSLSHAIYRFANPDVPSPPEFTYANWEQALREIANLAQKNRLTVFVDEFTYLLETMPGIAGILQNSWDHLLSQSNLLLVLTGSHMGMMQRQVLSYQAPLYGRASAQLLLNPLPFGVSQAFFPGYTPEERVVIYAIFGGIPAYWERLDPSLLLSENIRRQLLTPNTLMQDEPRLLLQDFVTDPHNYVAILRAIAGDARTQKEISTVTGLAQGHVSKYLSVLREVGYVERRVPITESERSRKGRYYITDPYLRFYYRFLSTRQSQLAMGVQERALSQIEQNLPGFIGSHTWEELCREWLLRAGDLGALQVIPDRVGSIWSHDLQIDVAGIHTRKKTLVLGECKWSEKPVGRGALNDLVGKTSSIVPDGGKWTVFYLGFARNGWTKPAERFAREMDANGLSGSNWNASGMILLDLDRVENDLVRWANPI